MVPALGWADRVITTPQGRKIPSGNAKVEFLAVSGEDTYFGWLGYGIDQYIEIEFYGESYNSKSVTAGLNLSYNYLSPITDLAPGISFGVLDVSNQTRDERAFYAAVTYFFGNLGDLNQNIPTEFTFGGWSRNGGQLFTSVSLPFSEGFRLIGEYDGREVNAGVEIVPFDGASLKWMVKDRVSVVGFGFQRRF